MRDSSRMKEPDIAPILVSKKEAARLIAVCVRTVDNLIASKALPARKVGRRTLVPYRALLDFARHDHPSPGKSNPGGGGE